MENKDEKEKENQNNQEKKLEDIIYNEIFVEKWLDYVSKYGLAYLLNNGYYGVCFNDKTKIILNPETNDFIYIEKIDGDKIINKYNMEDYPKRIHKKMILLNLFKSMFERNEKSNNLFQSAANKLKKEKEENKNNKENKFIYVKKYYISGHAYIFHLSDNNFHVCFKDKSEIFLSRKNLSFAYANKKGEYRTFPLKDALTINIHEVQKRIKYTEEYLIIISNRKKSKKSDKKKKKMENLDEDDLSDLEN